MIIIIVVIIMIMMIITIMIMIVMVFTVRTPIQLILIEIVGKWKDNSGYHESEIWIIMNHIILIVIILCLISRRTISIWSKYKFLDKIVGMVYRFKDMFQISWLVESWKNMLCTIFDDGDTDDSNADWCWFWQCWQ